MNFYPHNIGDYLKDTAHLDPLEDGIYRRMLDLYYSMEAPLVDDMAWLCKRLRLDQEKHGAIVRELLNDYFKATSKGFRHSRCDIEIGKASDKRKKAAESAGKRWHKDMDSNAMRTHSEGNATQQCEGNAPNPNPNPNPNPKKTIDANFVRFWGAYPKKLSKGQAERAFKAIKPNEQLLADILKGIERAKTSEQWRKDSGQFIPHPATWLNAKGWEDEIAPAAGVTVDLAAQRAKSEIERTRQMLDNKLGPQLRAMP